MRNVTDSRSSASGNFQQVVAAFLAQPGLPFAGVLSAERVNRIFAKHGNLFGVDAIDSTVVMVWSFLGQVLRDGKEASCQAAVARVVSHREQAGSATPTADTGDYCRARAKLSKVALRDLTKEVAEELQQRADSKWLWKGLHNKLVDGFPVFPFQTTRHHAGRSQQPGGVSASAYAEEGSRSADRASGGDLVLGHGLRDGGLVRV